MQKTQLEKASSLHTEELLRENQFLLGLNEQLCAHIEKNRCLLDEIRAQKDKSLRDLREVVDFQDKEIARLRDLKNEAFAAQSSLEDELKELAFERSRLEENRKTLEKEVTSLKAEVKAKKRLVLAAHAKNVALLESFSSAVGEADEKLQKIRGEQKIFTEARETLRRKNIELGESFARRREKFKTVMQFVFRRLGTHQEVVVDLFARAALSLTKSRQEGAAEAARLRQGLSKAQEKLLDYHRTLQRLAEAGRYDFNAQSVEEIVKNCAYRRRVEEEVRAGLGLDLQEAIDVDGLADVLRKSSKDI